MSSVSDPPGGRVPTGRELFKPRLRDTRSITPASAVSPEVLAQVTAVLVELDQYQRSSTNLLLDPRFQQLAVKTAKDLALLLPSMALQDLSREDLNNLGLVAAFSTEGGLGAKLLSAAKVLLVLGPVRKALLSDTVKAFMATSTDHRLGELRENFEELVRLTSGRESLPSRSRAKVIEPLSVDNYREAGSRPGIETRSSQRKVPPLLLEGTVIKTDK